MGAIRGLERVDWRRIERIAAWALIAAFLLRGVLLCRLLLMAQPAGLDFLPLWTVARIDPARAYDFAYVTAQQAWLYVGDPRPFIYPPSALPFLRPFGALPFWVAYPAFVAMGGALFLWASRRLGADWRLLILPPPILLVALAGQVTFLIGGLVTAALTLKNRPLLAGVLLGVAGAIKPQMLVLLPLALIVERNWRTFVTTGATAALIALGAVLLGGDWGAWLAALPRFTALVAADRGLVATTLTPFAAWGVASLVVTVPIAAAGVWLAFRRGEAAHRVLALLGGALLVSPYVMNYEIALLVPAVLALGGLALWTFPFWLALMFFPYGPTPLIVAMALLFVSLAARSRGIELRLQRADLNG